MFSQKLKRNDYLELNLVLKLVVIVKFQTLKYIFALRPCLCGGNSLGYPRLVFEMRYQVIFDCRYITCASRYIVLVRLFVSRINTNRNSFT